MAATLRSAAPTRHEPLVFGGAPGGHLGAPPVNDQIVEIAKPGLQILLYSPLAARDMEPGRNYSGGFPDGEDLVDQVNRCRFGAIGTRWPDGDYWLHFSSTMDTSVVARASDHLRLGLEVSDQRLCVAGGDDLFDWPASSPDERVVTVANGLYEVTVCMLPQIGGEPVRIYLHFAPALARPELGYEQVPELYCQAPLW